MSDLNSIDANILIAMLRGLTHESERVSERLNDDALDEQTTEELDVYGNDLDQAISCLMEVYEKRRNAGGAEAQLTEIGLLLNYFKTETLV